MDFGGPGDFPENMMAAVADSHGSQERSTIHRFTSPVV
jgi:hypothetical protein